MQATIKEPVGELNGMPVTKQKVVEIEFPPAVLEEMRKTISKAVADAMCSGASAFVLTLPPGQAWSEHAEQCIREDLEPKLGRKVAVVPHGYELRPANAVEAVIAAMKNGTLSEYDMQRLFEAVMAEPLTNWRMPIAAFAPNMPTVQPPPGWLHTKEERERTALCEKCGEAFEGKDLIFSRAEHVLCLWCDQEFQIGRIAKEKHVSRHSALSLLHNQRREEAWAAYKARHNFIHPGSEDQADIEFCRACQDILLCPDLFRDYMAELTGDAKAALVNGMPVYSSELRGLSGEIQVADPNGDYKTLTVDNGKITAIKCDQEKGIEIAGDKPDVRVRAKCEKCEAEGDACDMTFVADLGGFLCTGCANQENDREVRGLRFLTADVTDRPGWVDELIEQANAQANGEPSGRVGTIVAAGVDPNDKPQPGVMAACDHCKVEFRDEDLSRTCDRYRHLKLCQACYDKAGSTVR